MSRPWINLLYGGELPPQRDSSGGLAANLLRRYTPLHYSCPFTGVSVTCSIQSEALENLCRDIFVAAGTPLDIAAAVAESLVMTNLFGHDSHGVLRVKQYVTMIREGMIQTNERPRIKKRFGATAMVEGGYGFGQISARFSANLAIELGKIHGIAAVSLGQCTHIGRAGEYTQMIAAAGLIGICFTSGTMFKRLGSALWRARTGIWHQSHVLRCALRERG